MQIRNLLAITYWVAMLTIANRATAQDAQRTITKVEPVSVSSPVGTAPRLPYQLLVKVLDCIRYFLIII